MSIKRLVVTGISLIALAVGSAQADDLMQVYEQALHNDPVFKQAQSNWWSAKQNLPIAVSAYLPQVEVTDTLERIYNKTRPAVFISDGYRTQNVLTLTATQAIFDFNIWTNIAEQSASVKSATATYLAAIQQEMASTATAYFNVLAAYDKLRFTISNKKAVLRQLVTAQQKFKVGLIAITGVYDAQARYDEANADEISDRNALYDQLENLRAITGQHYSSLMGINVQVPLVVPAPDDITTWVGTAVNQNYSLKADNWSAIQAHRTVLNVALGGYMPSLDATGAWARTNNFHHTHVVPGVTNSWNNNAYVGLSLDWNPFSGGTTYYSTKQARYNYLTALGVLEQEHRDVINQTRQSFLGVKSSISRIGADKQSIISARNALQATEAGYTVGTRTMVDVLNDLTQVYRNENQYMDDQYTYINNFIALKQNAGTLNIHDLEVLNSWLKKNIKFPLPASYYGHSVPDESAVMDQLKVLTKKTPLMLSGPIRAERMAKARLVNQSKTMLAAKQQKALRLAKLQKPLLKLAPPAQHKPAAALAQKTVAPLMAPKAAKAVKTVTTVKLAKATKSSAAPKVRVAVANKQMVSAPAPKHSVKSSWSASNNNNYVIQLFAATSLPDAQKYVRHSKLRNHLNIVKADNLYKVFYGRFKTRSDALIALDALPFNHATNDAWVLKYIPPKQIPVPGLETQKHA